MIDESRLRSLGLPSGLSERIDSMLSDRDALDTRKTCYECQKLKRIDFCTSKKQKPVFLLQRCPDFLELK